MLTQFGPGIWTWEGPVVVAALGFHYPTRMALIRLSGGRLFVWSPIQISEAVRTAIDALGDVRYLIAPNSLHHVFLGDWARAYPHAEVHGAPGLRDKRRDIAFASDLGDEASAAWSGEIDQSVMRGNRITSEVVFFHRESATVLFTDLLQQFPRGWFRGWRGLVAGLDLMTGPDPAVPRKFRAAFTDRAAARAALKRILGWPADKVLMAHGPPVVANAPALLSGAFAWLQRT